VADPRTVKAREGDTLCVIAIRDGGFLDCGPLRADPANAAHLVSTLAKGTRVTVPPFEKKEEAGKATKSKHAFKKKTSPLPGLRFVHGSKDLPYAKDATLQVLQVSNFPSDKGGRYPTTASGPVTHATMPALPSGFGFNQDGHNDPDTFKIEVVDPREGSDTIKVKLTALKPLYAAGKVVGHTTFAAADRHAATRSIEVECKRAKPGLKVFRSRYLRLVTNKTDFDTLAPNKQALFVGPMADGAAGAADEIEVLDQRVRAEFQLASCPAGSAKCTLVAELPVGDESRQRRVKAAVHVLRNGRGGAGVVTVAQARQSVLDFVREIYAQAELGPKLVDPKVRLVEPPGNMIAISDRLGLRAEGGKTLSVRVRVDAGDNTVSITTVAGHTPRQTAERLAAQIRSATGTDARVSTNPPITGRAIGSADVLVGDPQTQNVRLTIVTSDDRQRGVVARIAGTVITEFGGDDANVGTLDERVLVKNYDSGSDRIDTFIVGSLSAGSFGEAFNPSTSDPKSRRPKPPMVNSVIVDGGTQSTTTNAHTTVPHEWAHVLMDTVHILNPSTELLFVGSPVGANEQVVNAPRRIGDPPPNKAFQVEWDGGIKGNPVKRLRTQNAALLAGW
jgi:hypothetical protein